MTGKQYTYILLIAIGILSLLTNLNILPTIPSTYWNIIWPVLIIILGLAIYYFSKKNPNDVIISWDNFDDLHIKIGNWEPKNPIVRTIIGFLAIIIALTIVGLVIFGFITPILAVVAIIVFLVILVALGITFISVLLPLVILAAPFILIIGLVSLLF